MRLKYKPRAPFFNSLLIVCSEEAPPSAHHSVGEPFVLLCPPY
ncbi:hypothetical protein LINPERPRIM_LOCUS30288 [Linum perenne]